MAYPSQPTLGTRALSKDDLASAMSQEIEKGPLPKKYGVVLVGLGRSGHFHLTSIKNLPEVTTLRWVIDVNESVAKRIAGEMGCRWSTSLDDALKDPEADMVIIASTTDTHFPFIMRSLEANKAVFAEKPISHEVNEVQEACDLALKKNLPFVCGYQRRCDLNFRALKKHLDSDAIGQLKMIKSCSRDNPVPPMEYLRTSGGIFQDMLIHDFDMQEWLSGGQVPESVLAVGHCYDDEIRKMDDIDMVAVLVKYSSGLITTIDTCRDAAYGYDQRVEAFGAKGMLTAKNEMTSSVEIATVEGHLMPPAKWSFPERYNHAYMVELSEFVALVRAGVNSDAHKLEQKEMMRHPKIVRTAWASELSFKLGRQVNLSEDLHALQKEVEAKKAASK
eukprot:TRINITY_DN33760_c0_g1_i1.p1 TRINITY_DN33760_c0_g1~~TRINITY_DN33760_c0_g1_i1.p1  ORF type:complete len:416 (+),score=99.18 TRINITY_DN33760_c0_g1_i1:79-1248(+)